MLHPKRDDLSQHLRQESNGLLTSLTIPGEFHLARLRLNRPPLVALRRARAEDSKLREELEQARAQQKLRREHLLELDGEIEQILKELARFSGE